MLGGNPSAPRNAARGPSVGQIERGLEWRNAMDRQRIEGGLKKTTGAIKEQVGKAIGDRHLENEGKAEKAEGHVRSGIGKAMDAVREIVSKEK